MGKGGCVPRTINPLLRKKKHEITVSQLETKNSVNECWIAYEGIVYDVTNWLPKHPGGMRAIMSCVGGDATSVMKQLHAPETLTKYMKRIRRVGILVDNVMIDTNDEIVANEKRRISSKNRSMAIQKDFELLNNKLLREGWYKATPLRYWAPVLRAASYLYIGYFLVQFGKPEFSEDNPFLSKFALILGSILLGFYYQNIAFMGHDAGHGSISGDFQIDAWLGFILGNLLTGIDIGWWKSTHYAHHSSTNCVHEDPDIQHLPLMCFEERMADNLWSAYHGRFMPLDDIARAIVPYQHIYFYPVMAVARFNLYIQSLIYIFDTRPFLQKDEKSEEIIDENTGQVKEKYAWPRAPVIFWIGQVVSLAGYYYSGYCILSSLNLLSAIICLVVSHVAAGILHVQILISHTAMEYCTGGSGAHGATCATDGSDETGYYEWQALSTMDVACPPWLDWFHGGLNFQLEHHLFPRIPRWKLRTLMPLVDEIFVKYDIPVKRIPFIEANRIMCNHLADVGAAISKVKSV